MIRFLHPDLLWLLGVVPLALLWRSRRGAAGGALRITSTGVARAVGGVARRSHFGRIVPVLRAASLTAAVVGLARPQLGHESSEVEVSGVDIVLAVDVSRSMEALDFEMDGQRVDRLDVVKHVVGEFIDKRPNDRIGLIAFAGRPYLVSPLTLDHDWLQQRLKSLHTGMIEDGTAIGSALASATNRLHEEDGESRIVVLLTDGMNNAGSLSPLAAAEAAKALGVKAYTIAAGTKGEVPIPMQDVFGRTTIGNAQVDIDEDSLREIADVTAGQFFRATDTDSLTRIYDRIDELETTDRTLHQEVHWSELFTWFAGLAAALVALELALAATWLRRLP